MINDNLKKNNLKKSILFFFVDGFGLTNDNENNPISNFKIMNNLDSNMFYTTNNDKKDYIKKGENWILKPIDACLGVDGLPQSATGQSSIFTGENTAKAFRISFKRLS